MAWRADASRLGEMVRLRLVLSRLEDDDGAPCVTAIDSETPPPQDDAQRATPSQVAPH